MLTSLHALVYSDDAAATRAFFRDVLQWPWTQDPDSEPDWPIFSTGPSELGVHPTKSMWKDETYTHPRHHSVALMCDDIEATVRELRGRGANFSDEISDRGFGLAISLRVPGADDILLYEPRHPTAYDR